jgi:hypothetical protein
MLNKELRLPKDMHCFEGIGKKPPPTHNTEAINSLQDIKI